MSDVGSASPSRTVAYVEDGVEAAGRLKAIVSGGVPVHVSGYNLALLSGPSPSGLREQRCVLESFTSPATGPVLDLARTGRSVAANPVRRFDGAVRSPDGSLTRLDYAVAWSRDGQQRPGPEQPAAAIRLSSSSSVVARCRPGAGYCGEIGRAHV